MATLVHDAPPPPVLPPPDGEERRPPSDAWPHTRRPMPWLIAVFMVMVYTIPFDSTVLPIKLPFNAGLDRLVLVVLAVVWLLLSIGGRIPPRFSHTPINVAIFFWVLLTALSLALNLRDLAWDQELSTAVKQLLLAYTYLLLFYIVSSSLIREDVVPFCKLLVVLGVISAIGTIIENRAHINVFSDLARAIPGAKVHFKAVVGGGGAGARHSYAGPTKHGLADATMLNAAIPFAMVLLWRARGFWPRVRWGAALLLLITGCVATEEKTAFILLIGTVFLMVAIHPRRYVKWWPLLIVAVIVTRTAAPHSISQLLYQFKTLGSSNSTSGRTTDYPAVAPFLDTHLLFGRGFGSYEPHKYRILDDQMLGFLIETGAAGVLAYAAVILTPAFAVLRAARRGLSLEDDMLAGIGAGCAAFFVSNFLYDSFSFRQGPYVFFVLAALAAAVIGRRGSTLGAEAIAHPAAEAA